MPWFQMDDSAYDHPKVASLSDAAFRLWVTAGMYCARHLTDGVITPTTLRILHARTRQCDELRTTGLWERMPEGGYRMHDYLDYNRSREWHQDQRRREREKKAKQREKANKDPETGRYV